MQGDDRSRASIAALDLQKINEQLRRLSDQIARIEGRSGGINLRDSISLKSNKQTLIDFDTTDSGKGAIVAYGTENATLAFAKGAYKEDNGEWVATDTVATIFAIDRTGNGTLYYNTGLTIGQAFSPTSSYVIGSGGAVAQHALVSSTHTASGLTTGHVLRATGATTFAFGTADSAYFTGTNWTDLTDGGNTTLHIHNIYAPLAGATFTGDVAFNSATSAKPYISINNTNADADAGYLDFTKYSASPADNDTIGSLRFLGYDDGSNATAYAALYGISYDVTGGTEDGGIDLYTMDGGTFQINTRFGLGQTEFYRPLIIDSTMNVGTSFAGKTFPTIVNAEANWPTDHAWWHKRVRRYDAGTAGGTAMLAMNGGNPMTGSVTINVTGTGTDEIALVTHCTVTTTTATNNAVSLFCADAEWDMGDVMGGFFWANRFCNPASGGLKSDGKLFMGMHTSTTTIAGTTEPSALTNVCGIAKDSGDGNFQFIHNDASGAATKVDLGVAYNGLTARFWYEFIMHCPRNGGIIYYALRKLSDNSVVASGSVNSNLPATGNIYAPHLHIANGAGSSTMRYDWGFLHIEARS